jgi:hypothetical protein
MRGRQDRLGVRIFLNIKHANIKHANWRKAALFVIIAVYFFSNRNRGQTAVVHGSAAVQRFWGRRALVEPRRPVSERAIRTKPGEGMTCGGMRATQP